MKSSTVLTVALVAVVFMAVNKRTPPAGGNNSIPSGNPDGGKPSSGTGGKKDAFDDALDKINRAFDVGLKVFQSIPESGGSKK